MTPLDPRRSGDERGTWSTKVRRRHDGTARWDVWYDDQHIAGAVERDGKTACEQAAFWLRVNDLAAEGGGDVAA